MIGRVKICIVSDSHDRAEALERAVRDAAAEGAQAVIHCGDLIGAHTLRPALGAEQVANVKGGRTWLVDPGTIAGLAAPATWALGDLAAMRFEVFSIAA